MSGFSSFLNNKKNKGLAAVSIDDLHEEIHRRKTIENPYPLEVFPEQIKPFITWLNSKEGYDIPASFIGSCLLSVWSSAIGTGAVVSTNNNDKIYLATWLSLLGISSSGKSLAISKIFQPLFNIQNEFDREWEESTKGLTLSEVAQMNMPTVVYRDSHIATLSRYVLPDNPKGVVKHSDEILEWINGMDQLSKKEGTDQQFWLSTWNCAHYSGIRSGKQKFTLRRPFVNVVGGAQYKTVHRLFLKDRDTSGFIFRLLFATPEVDRIAQPNPRFEMPTELEHRHEAVVKSMYTKLMVDSEDDEPSLMCVLSKDASDLWQDWVNAHIRRINTLEDKNEIDTQASILGKIKEYALRFVAILHIADKLNAAQILEGKCVASFAVKEAIKVEQMQRALKLADYYFNSCVSVYDNVLQQMIAPKEVLVTAFLMRQGKPITEIAAVIYGSKNDASRKKMERSLKKWIVEYPRVFGAIGGR